MSKPPPLLSSTVKAGRLLRLLGWITLALTVIIGAAITIPIFAKGDPFPSDLLVALAVAVAVVILYLVIGAAVKTHRTWAKVLGVILALLSLANVPIGTVIGAFALFYLVRGWREQPIVA